jgi:protein involved in plasmid replication-relaxation
MSPIASSNQAQKPTSRDILSNLCGKADEQDNQYLYRFGIPTASKGNVERIFTLGEQGYKFLREGGYIPDTLRFRRRSIDNLNYNYLIHSLAITRFLVAAYWWSKNQDTYTLIDTKTSYEIASKANGIIPDGWLLFERKDGMRGALILEVDRGTEFQQQFKAHVAARLRFIESGADQRLFGERQVVFVLYVTVGKIPYRHTRRHTMAQWTREVLKEQGREKWSKLFKFADVGLNDIYEKNLFDEAVWETPDSDKGGKLFSS